MLFENINNTMLFSIISFVYMFFLTVLFLYKKKIKSTELTIYKWIIITNLLTLMTECFIVFCILTNSPLLTITLKLFNIFIFSYISLIGLYSYFVVNDNIYLHKKRLYFLGALCVLADIAMMILPVYLYDVDYMQYSYGPSINMLYGSISVILLLVSGTLIINFKNIKKKKALPIIVLIVLLVINVLVQHTWPNILLVNSIFSFITFMMYFTVENPDVKMIEQLEVAKNSADRANRAKTDFLSSMSHEIRTPLNAIVGFSDCITEAKTLDEAKDNAKDIVNASTTLLEIVNGILDISKIEAGKLEIVNSNYDAKELFEELAKLIRPKMDEKALDFKYYIAPDLPPVLYGDHASIKKVVTNLLSNAYKYTDKGYVNYEVNCIRSKDACKLIISVEDTGRGIKKDSVDSLFTKFQRLEEDRNTTIEGTGLGLAITKQLVELMGGKIIVHTVYGEGSKFTIMLNQRIEKEEVIEEKPKVDSENLDLSGRKILLVDDNNLNLKVANKLLEKYGATDIDCVESGFECLDKINAGNKYDVILLDDMMPKMSGIETLEKLKEIEGFNIPVVALTANAITGMREKYLAKGFDDYLPKPIERKDLITVMNNVLGNEIVKEEPKEEKFLIQEVDSEVEGESKEDSSFDGEKYLRDNGVDMDNALELLGDMEMYNDTLDDYLSEIDSKLEELKKYKEENNMKEYSVLVHSMKSDAKYLGFMDFADIAYQHELKSKENDSDFVNDNFEKLEEELTKVINIAKDYKKQA